MPSPTAAHPQWWAPAEAFVFVLLVLRSGRSWRKRLRIGSSTTVADGHVYRLGYRGDLTWSVHRDGVYLGTIFNEDWTHYSYILAGNEPITGPETSVDWRITLRALSAA